ncbi:MAG: hypothetical protein MK042_04765 [Cognatishimia sp.]|nr:hypothetical protein [Cognatishimia sp.]
MSDRWLHPDLGFDGQELLKNAALRVVDGVVQSLVSTQDALPSTEEIFGILSPGFVDLQVNGGGGVLFNATPTADGIRKITAAHRQFGTTGILPTVITDTKEVLAQAVDAVLEAQGSEGILGIHIEGPISRWLVAGRMQSNMCDRWTTQRLATLRVSARRVWLS